jgi:glutaredoxin
MIYLFCSITCAPCNSAKELLTKKGIEYTCIDVDETPSEAKAHKIMKLPTLMVIHDGTKEYIQGWKRNAYLALLRKVGAIKESK